MFRADINRMRVVEGIEQRIYLEWPYQIGVAHEKPSPKNQPYASLTMMKQYWLGKTKPKGLT